MTACRVLGLLPFLVKHAVSIAIFRGMPAQGVDVTVAFSADASALYVPDPMEDFIARDRLIDLTGMNRAESFKAIDAAIEDRGIDLILQVGAPLYSNLPLWRESNPSLRIADMLYNELGHTLNHFLYEPCIDGVVVESQFMRRYVERASCKQDPGVEQAPTGVDLELFNPRDRPASDGSPFTIGYIGRMSPEKNPMGFIDLAEHLLELDPDLQFRMTGGGPDETDVKQRLAASPYRDRFAYTGFIDDRPWALHRIDVLIVPSKFDGRPVTIMEANACGIPVIAAPVGGVPEMIDDGVNGYLWHPEEIGSIHDLLAKWKAAPDLFTQLGRSAREYARRMFDSERMMVDYARAFRKIAASEATSEAQTQVTLS